MINLLLAVSWIIEKNSTENQSKVTFKGNKKIGNTEYLQWNLDISMKGHTIQLAVGSGNINCLL